MKAVSSIRKIRGQLTYANVMATLAVFIAFGGSSYAVTRISGSQIRNNSVSYKKLKRNTLGGSRIKESRLGMVPRARRAHHANRLQGLRASDLKLKCPAGTQANAGVCVETTARSAEAHSAAKVTCEMASRRLPTYQELVGVLDDQANAVAPGGELTADVYPSSSRSGFLDVLVVTTDTGRVTTVPGNFEGARAFRCVSNPSN